MSAQLRRMLESFYRMRDTAQALRAEETAAGASLRTRIAWASVIETIDVWIAETHRALSVIARRGAPSMAHGCAALVPAVGPAHLEPTGRDAAIPASPLLLCPDGQSLPAAVVAGNTQTA